MTLPTITMPAVPPFLATTHDMRLISQFANVQNAQGTTRRRRLFTVAPQTVDVSWDLTQAEMALVDDWFEVTLRGGKEQFTATIANLGAGTVDVGAEWVTPYTADPDQAAGWHVTGKLIIKDLTL